MATKPPSSVQEFPLDALETIAYESVRTLPTQEPNDRNRLGYHVWRWLKTRQGSLEQAIAESGSRLHVKEEDALKIIRDALAKQGITVE
ncbi:MAG: hypothetical protein HYR76_11980 [Ignavibacteria bacterium]|nr:hypothetical protein [Ignavibacteria bacterium]